MSPSFPEVNVDTRPRASAAAPWVPAVIAAAFATHLIYFSIERRPFAWDEAWYAETAIRMNDAIVREGLFGGLAFFLNALQYKAPLIVLLPQPFLFLFGPGDVTFGLVNASVMAVACVYVARIARRFTSNAGAALAVAMFSMMPMTAAMTRIYLVEMSLTALVAMAIDHWLASENFTSRRHSAWLGVALGLGLLGKLHFPVFVAGILILAAWHAVRAYRAPGRLAATLAAICAGPALAIGCAYAGVGDFGVLLGLGLSAGGLFGMKDGEEPWRANLALAGTFALWIPLPWYLFNGQHVLEFAYQASVGPLSKFYGAGSLFDWNAIRDYWLSNLNHGVGTAFALCLTSTLLLWLVLRALHVGEVDRTDPPRVTSLACLVAAWIVPALIVFTSGRNRETRFILPLFPTAALLYAALTVDVLRRIRPLARLLVTAQVALVAVVYLGFSFGGPRVAFGEGERYVILGDHLSGRGAAVREAWPLNDIIAATMESAHPSTAGRPVRATMLTDSAPLNFNTLTLEAVRKRCNIEFNATAYQATVEQALPVLDTADVLIYQEGPLQAPDYTNRWGREIRRRIDSGALRGWRRSSRQTVVVPNGGRVCFFERLDDGVDRRPPEAGACCVLFQNGTLMLTGLGMRRTEAGLWLSTRWVKIRADASRYAIAAHLISEDGRYALNADYSPPGGDGAFAAARVGATIQADTFVPAGEWARRATHLRMALYDMTYKTNAEPQVVEGPEAIGDGFLRLPLPAPASQPAADERATSDSTPPP